MSLRHRLVIGGILLAFGLFMIMAAGGAFHSARAVWSLVG